MNTINGKPIGDIEEHGARDRGYAPKCGVDTVSMTFSELEALWKKVRPDNRIKQ